jgi:predicted phosphodiesterase
MLADATATVMAGGHTHIQMLRQHHGNLLVNPGSVGLAFKDYVSGGRPTILAHAEYAIVQDDGGIVEVRLRRVALDRDKLWQASSRSDHPLREFLQQQYS